MDIKAISSKETLALRHDILRPGKAISACIFDGDDAPKTRHFGAIDKANTVVGIVSVYCNNPSFIKATDSFQIRAMATSLACRGQGVGNLLLAAAENYAKEENASLIWANARSSAIGFYIKAGYRLASEEFIIDGIGPHYRVTKTLI